MSHELEKKSEATVTLPATGHVRYKPLVSVAIVTYNQRAYLRELLESVLAQDYPNIEVIVADDASTDGAQDVCREFEARYPGKVFCELAQKNAGITANANVAFRRCTGDFMCPVSGDDVFLPGKISAQIDWMERNPAGALCGCGVEVFDSATNATVAIVNDPVLRRGGSTGAMIRQSCATPTSAFMFRQSLCKGIYLDSRTPIVSDWLFIVEACMRGKYGCVDRIHLRYRRHGENTTSYGEENSHIEDRLIYTDIFFARYRSHYFSLKIQRAKIFYEHGKRCGYEGKQGKAVRFMLFALGEWPLAALPWCGLFLSLFSIGESNLWRSSRRLFHQLRGIKSPPLPGEKWVRS